MKVREKRSLRVDDEGRPYTQYDYLARFGRTWVNLGPYGNCVERAREALSIKALG